MEKEKYCQTCGREFKTEFRTVMEVINNINSLLGTEVYFHGKKKDLLKLEEGIKNLKSSQ